MKHLYRLISHIRSLILRWNQNIWFCSSKKKNGEVKWIYSSLSAGGQEHRMTHANANALNVVCVRECVHPQIWRSVWCSPSCYSGRGLDMCQTPEKQNAEHFTATFVSTGQNVWVVCGPLTSLFFLLTLLAAGVHVWCHYCLSVSPNPNQRIRNINLSIWTPTGQTPVHPHGPVKAHVMLMIS